MSLFEQFLRFTGVGIFGTAAHYSVLVVCVQLLDVNPVVAAIFGFIVGAVINYYLNYHYTFKSCKDHIDVAPKFFTVAVSGMIMNAGIMWLLMSSIHYLAAQLVATGVVFLSNFVVNRQWTFQTEHI